MKNNTIKKESRGPLTDSAGGEVENGDGRAFSKKERGHEKRVTSKEGR